jgi:hypothetical protein
MKSEFLVISSSLNVEQHYQINLTGIFHKLTIKLLEEKLSNLNGCKNHYYD